MEYPVTDAPQSLDDLLTKLESLAPMQATQHDHWEDLQDIETLGFLKVLCKREWKSQEFIDRLTTAYWGDVDETK